MNTRNLVLAFVFTFSFLVVSAFSSTSVLAQRTCCVTGTTGCGACDTSGTYWKTDDGSGRQNICGSDSNCKICGTDGYNKDQKIGNACAGAGASGVCRYPSTTPKTLTLKVNQSFVLASNAFANGITMGSMRASSTLPTVASVSPTFQNLCCEWSYNYRQTPVYTTVSALAEGKTSVTTTFYPSDTTNKGTCYSTASITVKGVADIPACIPGTTCTSNTGVVKVGSKIACSMPKVTDSGLLALGTPSYYIRCNFLNSKGAVASSYRKTSNSGQFSQFTIAKGVVKAQCSFRYCLTNTTGVITCSKWGTANI